VSECPLSSVADITTRRNPPAAYQNQETRARGLLDSRRLGTSRNGGDGGEAGASMVGTNSRTGAAN
jgi:hypothetical protein